MFPYCPNNPCVSLEYGEFIKAYHQFLKYYVDFFYLNVTIQSLKGKNTQFLLLYEQAIEAHLNSINAYIQMNTVYERLVQKYWDSIYRGS